MIKVSVKVKCDKYLGMKCVHVNKTALDWREKVNIELIFPLKKEPIWQMLGIK
jgi:hypothetical protein